jgi:hypothetical protein
MRRRRNPRTERGGRRLGRCRARRGLLAAFRRPVGSKRRTLESSNNNRDSRVDSANGQALAYVYFEEDAQRPSRSRTTKPDASPPTSPSCRSAADPDDRNLRRRP